MKAYYVYITRCSDGTLYCGYTTNIQRRLRMHNGEIPGGAKYTAGRRPVEIVYQETFSERSSAQSREAEIKRLSRAEKELLLKH